MSSLFPTLVTHELPIGSPYPVPAPSGLPTQLPSKDPPDKTIPDPPSTPGFLLYAYPHVTPNTLFRPTILS